MKKRRFSFLNAALQLACIGLFYAVALWSPKVSFFAGAFSYGLLLARGFPLIEKVSILDK